MENYQAPGRGLRPLLSLARRARISLLIAVAVFILGLPIVWIKGQSSYSAEAVFQVWPNFQKTLSGDKDLELQSNSQYREFVNHLSRSVVRFDVLEGAFNQLEKDGVDPCIPRETRRKCIERFQKLLLILPIPDTYMVRVGYSSDKKDDLDKVVNAILDSFIETAHDDQLFGADDRLKQLRDRTKEVNGEMTELEKLRAQLAGKLGLTTFGENTNNPYDTVLALAREKLALAATERSQAQAMFDAYQNQREAPMAAGRSVNDLRQMDNALQTLRNEVVKHSEELTRKMAGLEPRHPLYQAALAEQQELQQRLRSMEANVDKSAQSNIRARLQASVLQTQQVEKDQRQRVQDIESQATTFAVNFREAMRLTGEIRKRTLELEELRNRVNFLNSERGAFGFVRVVTRALPAVTPQGLGRMRLLLALIVVTVIIFLVLPMGLDMLDRRILAVGDAERAMGIASAAWLVKVEDYATESLAREQRRRLASTLLRNRNRGDSRVFGFTSANVGGEVTDVILDLASTLKQLGSSVLVVDANTMRLNSPIKNEGAGLHELLAQRIEPMDAVHSMEFESNLLDVVSLGRTGDGSIQRLDLLRSAIETWSSHYDMILVDVPPLMLSSDAELLVDALGQIFLVVEVGSVSRGDVVQARNYLQKLSPTAVGLIVSKLPVDTAPETVKKQMVESITGQRFNNVMSTSPWRLQWEMIKIQAMRILRKHKP